jgi:hypothetical protein
MFVVDDLRPLFGEAYCKDSVMCDAPAGPPGGADGVIDAPFTPHLDRFLDEGLVFRRPRAAGGAIKCPPRSARGAQRY